MSTSQHAIVCTPYCMADQLTELGLQRAIEIISEASRHIPVTLQHASNIPWQAIRAMGNILRREYHRIADEVIWDVIVGDLSDLKAAMHTLRSKATDV